MRGQEFAAHDSKFDLSFATAYRMDCHSRRHTQSGGLLPPGLPFPNMILKSFSGRAGAFILSWEFAHVISCAGCVSCRCNFTRCRRNSRIHECRHRLECHSWGIIKNRRTHCYIRQAFNIRGGSTRSHSTILIEQQATAQDSRALAGITLDERLLDREFCVAMDWDIATAKPSKKKLIELGLDDRC